MNAIKVSVFVISYNQERYIRETLDSIVNQEHPFSYEVIVCDDASKDGTPQIISEYANKYKEIVPVLRKENIGLIANYFDAASRCRGEYIMVCAGDDYWLPGKIAQQVEYLDSHPDIGMIHSNVQIIDESGDLLFIPFGYHHKSVISLINHYTVKAVTIAFRKNEFDKYVRDINPLSHNWLMEDFPLSIWFCANKKMAYLPKVLAAYRMVGTSVTHQTAPEKIINFEKSVVEVVDYFKNNFKTLIPEDFFYKWQLKRLVTKSIFVNNYNQYCRNVLQKSKDHINKLQYYIFRLRINNNTFNRILKKIDNIKFRLDLFIKHIFQYCSQLSN